MSAVNSQILKKFNYVRSINPGRYLIFSLIKFPFECYRNHVWGPIFDPNYDHIYKCDYFGYTDGRAGGWSAGRTVGRADGRAGGRSGGRTIGRAALNKVGARWVCQSHWGHGRKLLAKF